MLVCAISLEDFFSLVYFIGSLNCQLLNSNKPFQISRFAEFVSPTSQRHQRPLAAARSFVRSRTRKHRSQVAGMDTRRNHSPQIVRVALYEIAYYLVSIKCLPIDIIVRYG